MFNEGGQPFHGMMYRGGGKGGGSNDALMAQLMQQQAAANPPPAPPTYSDPTTGAVYTTPQDLNAAIAQDQANAATTAASNEASFQTNKQNAYNAAMQSVMQTFQGQGADPNQYMNYITPQLQQAMTTIPDLAPDPGTYFPASLGQTILNQATGDARTRLTNQLNQTFSPTYSANALPTSMMDPSINSILSNQFNPLATELQNAQRRGTLTDAGYQAALNQMGTDKAAAQSQLQTLGQNILTGDRGALDTLASGARSDIANMTLGQNIDPTQYVNQANQTVSQDVSGFPGALQSAAGNVTFANIQDLLNAGGAVQGATNPTAANPMGGGGTGTIGGGGAMPLPGQEDTTKRGLGTAGAF